jgi:hypothetical protein
MSGGLRRVRGAGGGGAVLLRVVVVMTSSKPPRTRQAVAPQAARKRGRAAEQLCLLANRLCVATTCVDTYVRRVRCIRFVHCVPPKSE